MTTAEILVAARAKVEQGWTQGVLARDANGQPVSCTYESFGAVCWCAMGASENALYKAFGFAEGNPIEDKAYAALDAAAGGNIVSFNDAPGRTQAEVLAAFDRAIEAAA